MRIVRGSFCSTWDSRRDGSPRRHEDTKEGGQEDLRVLGVSLPVLRVVEAAVDSHRYRMLFLDVREPEFPGHALPPWIPVIQIGMGNAVAGDSCWSGNEFIQAIEDEGALFQSAASEEVDQGVGIALAGGREELSQ